MRITWRRAAEADLIGQFRYYLVTLGLPHVAERFREAVKSTARKISRYPDAATPCRLRNTQLHNLRSWPIDGFKATRIYFLADDGAMRVIRVLHGKQDVRRILEREKLSES
jgi:plasmid stabilization system protein ParE